jgi:thiol:disulfide interchange protein DsbD
MNRIFLILFSLISIAGFSQNILNPVKWDITYVEKSATDGEIVFTAIIEKKWHIYSQRPTEAGPIPTSFIITPNANFELVGKVVETDAHEEFVPAFDAKVFVFAEKAEFKQKVKRKTKNSFEINTSLEYMTCNDAQCLPPKTINLKVSLPAK